MSGMDRNVSADALKVVPRTRVAAAGSKKPPPGSLGSFFFAAILKL
jgi:hypothetical protein